MVLRYEVNLRFETWINLRVQAWKWQTEFQVYFNRPINGPKEGCNWGHGLSAAIKLGSLEKTVGTCLLHSGVYYEQSFSCRKNCTTQPFALVGDSRFFTKKRLAFFYGAKLIFRSFATFFGKTISWSDAKQRFCFTGCRSVWNQTARIWALDFLARWPSTSHALYYNLPYVV